MSGRMFDVFRQKISEVFCNIGGDIPGQAVITRLFFNHGKDKLESRWINEFIGRVLKRYYSMEGK